MANIFRLGGSSGAKKNYIFKDGVFSIQPTQSNMQVVNGVLTNGFYLDIPYQTTDKVFFELKFVQPNFNQECGMKVSTTEAPVTNGTGSFTNTAIRNIDNRALSEHIYIIMGLNGGSRISYCCRSVAQNGFQILSIWTEKQTGGGSQ